MLECEHDYACQCIHVYTHVRTGSRLCLTGHMGRARATEGVQLSSFVLSMGHDIIASEGLRNHCELLFSHKWKAEVHALEGFKAWACCRFETKTQIFIILNAHKKTT